MNYISQQNGLGSSLNYFAYIRVSTARQGEQGVSLQEQRDAIQRFAQQENLTVSRWFEERETAAKKGRPIFTDLLRRLRKGEAEGVIIHKIDRSARNLRDWAELGDLLDEGIEVLFAHDRLDLQSRGGRLTADIQAVVAADYIRNLRDEARKGFYGRLKQGLFPLPAPVGYLDEGPGKPKSIDPIRGPLVHQAFELYASGRYNLKDLRRILREKGLTNRRGTPLSLNGLSTVLNNPFYYGLIRLKRTAEYFSGAHEPLISKSLFDQVQACLRGRTNMRTQRHAFTFRRLVRCECGYSLIGERQKGRVYYRCHTQGCTTTSIREDRMEEALRHHLVRLQFSADERDYFQEKLRGIEKSWFQVQEAVRKETQLQEKNVRERLARLTDAYLDGVVEKPLFEERKAVFLGQQKECEERLKRLKDEGPVLASQHVSDFLELAGSAYIAYEEANPERKRELVLSLTSNRVVEAGEVEFTLRTPFDLVENRANDDCSTPHRAIPRIWDALLTALITKLVSEPSRNGSGFE